MRLITVTATVFALISVSRADTTSFVAQNFSTPILNHAGVALSAGTAANGDGSLIEVGYYNGAVAGNSSTYFTGSFVPLSGPNSANTLFSLSTTIGDTDSLQSGPFGLFAIQLDFDTTKAGASVVPTGALPLVLRFYDSNSIASSTYFNSVSSLSSNWNWTAPSLAGSTMSVSLDDASLVWQDGSNTFSTSLLVAVPEPATYAAILGLVTLGLVGYRRFRRS